MSVSEDRMINVEKHLMHVQKKVDEVHDGFVSFRQDIKYIGENLKKLSDVDTRMSRIITEMKETRKDVDTAFAQIRDLRINGTSNCNVHSQQIQNLEKKDEAIEKEVKGIKNKAYSVYLLFIMQLVQIILLLAKDKI